MLVNGRISSRSYPRYRLARRFFRQVLADVDRFCMQSDESARRIIDIGAEPNRVTVTGSLKFDSLESPAAAAGRGAGRVLRYFRISPSRPVFMAASTLKGEESFVLSAFATIRRAQPVGAARHRAAQAGALRGSGGARARRRPARCPANGARGRCRAARRRRHSRHDRRAGAPVSDRDGGVRRREPRRPGRPQHPRAGRPRQADRLRPAHGELRGDRRDVSQEPGGGSSRRRLPSSRAPCRGSSATRSSAPGWAPPRARSSKPTAAPSPARSTASPTVLPPPGSRGVVRPFVR